MYLMSKIFRPVETVLQRTKNVYTSKNHALLIDYGLMKQLSKGTFYYLPILQRSIDKATELIERFMSKIDAQKMSIPIITPAELWKKSGRFDTYESELFLLNDNSELLGPTFEEAMTHVMTFGHNLDEKHFPLRLYQIGTKFRDEFPRYGLLRSREFIMKDLYTFDATEDDAVKTYEEVNETYQKLFEFIGVPFCKVEADAKEMGGHLSHEYHYLSSIGEGKLQNCSKCGHSSVCSAEDGERLQCPKCLATENIEKSTAIEVGHAFLLGDAYTKPQRAHYMKDGKPIPMQMGCYGIGVTRLIGAAIEKLSTETHIRWPFALAPFTVCIIPPEKRSKAFKAASHYLDEVHHRLNSIQSIKNSILVDDRIRMTIGDRFRDARRLGIPLVVIIGRKASDPDNPQFELHFMYDEKECDLTLNDLTAEIAKYSMDKLRE